MVIEPDSSRINFIVIGTQKGGTSALDYYLRKNAQIVLPSTKKELHFFDDSYLNWEDNNYHVYHSQFDWSNPNAIRGEATPIYMYLPECMDRIKVYRRDIKLIVLLRNPVYRAYSHWRMECSRDMETLDFSTAIRKGRERLVTSANALGRYDYVERGFYDIQLAHIFKLFDRKHVLIVASDDLREKLLETLNKIMVFIGAAAFSTIVPRYVSPVESRILSPIELVDRSMLHRLYQDSILKTMDLTGCNLTSWLRLDYVEPEIHNVP
jgi:hypothetical protein